MELVREKVKGTLIALEEEEVESVMAKLMSIGVRNLDDCSFLQGEDLEGVLLPIQLIGAFHSGNGLI